MRIKTRREIPKAIDKWDAVILSYSDIDRDFFKSDKAYADWVSKELDNLIVHLTSAVDLVDDLFRGKL
jgi:hypothetical protein